MRARSLVVHDCRALGRMQPRRSWHACSFPRAMSPLPCLWQARAPDPADAHPSGPPPEHQRLLHAGSELRDVARLRDCLLATLGSSLARVRLARREPPTVQHEGPLQGGPLRITVKVGPLQRAMCENQASEREAPDVRFVLQEALGA